MEYSVNLLYNAYYGDKKTCIGIHPIDRNNIQIDDLKKPINYDYKEVFNAKFKLIGFYNNRYHYKRITDNIHSTTISIGINNLNQNFSNNINL